MKQALSLEFAVMRKIAPWILCMAAVVCAILAVSASDSFEAVLPALAGMVPALCAISVCAYDGVPGWERYRAVLPLARTDVVSARYVVGLAFPFAVIVAIGVAAVAIECLLGSWEGVDFVSAVACGVAAPLALGMSFSLLIVAFVFPCVFRFGYTNGLRVAVGATILLAVAAVGALVQFGYDVVEAAVSVLSESGIWGFIPLLVALFVLVLYFASMLLSIRFYSRREL